MPKLGFSQKGPAALIFLGSDVTVLVNDTQ